MKHIRLTALAAVFTIVTISATQAAKSFRSLVYWYDPYTYEYLGSTFDKDNPPTGCKGNGALCAYGYSSPDPTTTSIARAFKE